VRIHLPGWDGNLNRVEARLLQVSGVEAAEANPLTGNVLIRFDPRVIDLPHLLAALPRRSEPEPPPAGRDTGSPWLRVGVRGLIGHAVVDTLWFGAGFLGHRLGLPLAGLGPLHVLLDVLVWGTAVASVSRRNDG
jgi:hypothetical protein